MKLHDLVLWFGAIQSTLAIVEPAVTTLSARPTCTPDQCLKSFETHPKTASSFCAKLASATPTASVFPKACSGNYNQRVSSVCGCLIFPTTSSSSKSTKPPKSTKSGKSTGTSTSTSISSTTSSSSISSSSTSSSSSTTSTTPTPVPTGPVIVSSNPGFEQTGPDGTNSYPWSLYTVSASQVLDNEHLAFTTPYGRWASILWTDRTFLGSSISQTVNITSDITAYPFTLSYSMAFAPPAVSNTDSWTMTVQFGGQTIDNFGLTALDGNSTWLNRTVPIGSASEGANDVFFSFVYSGYDTPYNEAWVELDNLELSYDPTQSIS